MPAYRPRDPSSNPAWGKLVWTNFLNLKWPVYQVKVDTHFLLHPLFENIDPWLYTSPVGSENLFILICPRRCLNSDLWDCKPSCFQLNHPCLFFKFYFVKVAKLWWRNKKLRFFLHNELGVLPIEERLKEKCCKLFSGSAKVFVGVSHKMLFFAFIIVLAT